MNSFFYLKLALTNLKKHSKMVIPYLLTSTLFVMMFYVILSLSNHSEFYGRTRGVLLAFGVIVIAIFAFIFLFYTNSFIIKQRRSELGIYNILGMEKKHVSLTLMFETLIMALISISVGILVGSLFGQAIFLALMKMVGELPVMYFEITWNSIKTTILLFLFIFLCTMVYNISRIHLSKPIDLLKSKSEGEKEPKAKWFMALIGLVCLGSGYAIAILITNPMEVIMLFFVAVILVMIGTYLLFTAGSIALLKLMRKNKKYYYQTQHFISVSNMIYRMKQNAVGLANICILSTMVLVMLSSTGSLFLGIEDSVQLITPKDAVLKVGTDSFKEMIKADQSMMEELKSYDKKDFVHNYQFSATAALANETIQFKNKTLSYESDAYYVMLVANDQNALKENEVRVYFDDGTKLETLSIGNKNYHVAENTSSLKGYEERDITRFNPGFKGLVYVEMPSYKDVYDAYSSIDENEFTYLNQPSFNYMFDGELSDQQKEILRQLPSNIMRQAEGGYYYHVSFQDDLRKEQYEFFGSFFFLGVFLSILFMIATTLIMYYKQMSEGLDDGKRYEILQKVGLSHEEVKKTIHSQILIVFFMPLVMAGIHILFAFNMIYRMFEMFGITNKLLFMEITAGVFVIFSIFYFITYQCTAKVYYQIISSRRRT